MATDLSELIVPNALIGFAIGKVFDIRFFFFFLIVTIEHN